MQRIVALLLICIGLSAQGSGKLTLESLFHPSWKIQYLGAPATKLSRGPSWCPTFDDPKCSVIVSLSDLRYSLMAFRYPEADHLR